MSRSDESGALICGSLVPSPGRPAREPSCLGFVRLGPSFESHALPLTQRVRAGRVYHIPPELEGEIWPYLHHREKDGYTLRTVDVFGIDAETGGEVIVQKDVRSRSAFPVSTRPDYVLN